MLSVDLSLLSLFTQASPLVKAVMLILVLASCLSWTLIFQRKRLYRWYRQTCHAFEDQFWGGRDLGRLYQKLAEPSLYPQSKQGSQALFMGMYRTYLRLHQQLALSPAVVLEGVERHANILHQRELDKLNAHLGWLATIGSVTPYIGLFGTVWGIMNAFRALGQVQQASLSMVAPGISEALIATAMGLFAAIPAVIAFNRFSQERDQLQSSLALFAEELLGILHKQVHTAANPVTTASTAPVGKSLPDVDESGIIGDEGVFHY